MSSSSLLTITRASPDVVGGSKNVKRFLPQNYISVTNKRGRCLARYSESHGLSFTHLNLMVNELHDEEIVRFAARLESDAVDRARYLAIVTHTESDGSEQSAVFGFDITSETTFLGLKFPIVKGMTIKFRGDGGFYIYSPTRDYSFIFKPVSINAMWYCYQSLLRSLEEASAYNLHGESHLPWLDRYTINSPDQYIFDWEFSEDILSARSISPILGKTDSASDTLESNIKIALREILPKMDIDQCTCRDVKNKLEETLKVDLSSLASFVDEQMMQAFGQMAPPSQIFDHIYLGSEWNASNDEELQKLGVTHILNVTKEIDNFHPTKYVYKNIRVDDVEDADLAKHWMKDTFHFLDNVRKINKKCLVHCKMGVSRSASTVIAYAMKAYDMSYQDAFKYVKQRRSVINPNSGFRKDLEFYEGILKAKRQMNNPHWCPIAATRNHARSHSTGEIKDEKSDNTDLSPVTPDEPVRTQSFVEDSNLASVSHTRQLFESGMFVFCVQVSTPKNAIEASDGLHDNDAVICGSSEEDEDNGADVDADLSAPLKDKRSIRGGFRAKSMREPGSKRGGKRSAGINRVHSLPPGAQLETKIDTHVINPGIVQDKIRRYSSNTGDAPEETTPNSEDRPGRPGGDLKYNHSLRCHDRPLSSAAVEPANSILQTPIGSYQRLRRSSSCESALSPLTKFPLGSEVPVKTLISRFENPDGSVGGIVLVTPPPDFVDVEFDFNSNISFTKGSAASQQLHSEITEQYCSKPTFPDAVT